MPIPSTPIIILGSCLFLATAIYLWYWHLVANHFLQEPDVLAKIPNNELEIIIVFRNEESNLPTLLTSLHTIITDLEIPVSLVNDHSTDDGVHIIEAHTLYQHPLFQLITPPQHVQSKKQALRWQIHRSQSKHIFVSDADCVVSTQNLASMWHLHRSNQSSLTLGLVSFTANKTLVEQYQQIENTALVALSVFHAHQDNPSMGNAANMLLNRNDFLEVQPFDANLDVPGGDDIFLITALQKHQKKVIYANNPASMVHTKVLTNWHALWEQRIRWAKKSTQQAFSHTQKSQILLVLYLLLLWGISLHGWFNNLYALVLCVWLFKWFGEFLFLRKIFIKTSQPIPSFYYSSLASLVQSIFIPLVALGQFFFSVRWKNRRYS